MSSNGNGSSYGLENGNGNKANGGDRLPWERQIREPPKAWQAFNVYRELGPGRSVRAARAELGKSATVLETWSARWCWVARCAEWDDHIASAARAAEVLERERMAVRHVQLGIGLQNEVIRTLQARDAAWKAHTADPSKPAPKPLDPNDARQWALTGVTIERLARGEATERHEHGPAPVTPPGERTTERDIVAAILASPELAAAADTLAAAVEGVARGDGRTDDGEEPEPVDPAPAP